MIKRTVLTMLTGMLFVLTIMFSLVYKNRLFITYNEKGNFFDESSATAYHQTSVLVYGLMALFFFIASLISAIWTFKMYKTT